MDVSVSRLTIEVFVEQVWDVVAQRPNRVPYISKVFRLLVLVDVPLLRLLLCLEE